MTLAKTATKIIDNQTVALSSSADSSGVDLSSCIGLTVGYSITFDALEATDGVTVEMYGDPEGASQSFTIGANDDYYDAEDIPVDQGNTARGVLDFKHGPKYAKFRIVNNSSSYAITACSLWVQKQTA